MIKHIQVKNKMGVPDVGGMIPDFWTLIILVLIFVTVVVGGPFLMAYILEMMATGYWRWETILCCTWLGNWPQDLVVYGIFREFFCIDFRHFRKLTISGSYQAPLLSGINFAKKIIHHPGLDLLIVYAMLHAANRESLCHTMVPSDASLWSRNANEHFWPVYQYR